MTFRALFGRRGHSIDFTELAPPCLTVLASLLPGDPLVQLGNLLGENTFVPFAVPVIRLSVEEFMGTEFGDSKACLLYLAEDEALVGVPYLGIPAHRAHRFRAIVPSHSGPSRPPIPVHRARFRSLPESVVTIPELVVTMPE